MRRFPLQRWVPGALGLLAIALTSIAFVHDWIRSNYAVERAVRRRTMAVGNLIIPDLELSLAQSDIAKASAEIARLMLVPDMNRALVLDESNRILLASDPGLRGLPLAETLDSAADPLVLKARESREALSQILPGRNTLVAAFPSPIGVLPGELRPSRIAVLVLEADLRGLKHREMTGILQRSFAMGLAAVLICIGGWLYFDRTFARPLKQLVAGVSSYGKDRRSLQLPADFPDELGEIGRAVTRMAGDLADQDSALRQTEARQAAILESTLDALVTLDRQGCVADWNAAAERMFGHRAADATGRPLVELVVPPRFHDACRNQLLAAIAPDSSPQETPLEWTARDTRDREYPVELTVTPVRRDSARIIAVLRDLTERKRAEALLRSKDRLLREVIDLVPHFIFAKDDQGRFLFVNRAAANTTGLSPEDLVGKTDFDLGRDPDECRGFQRDDTEVLKSGRPKVVQAESLTDAHGRTRTHQTTKIPFDNPATGERALLGVAVDITELRMQEDSLRREAAFRSAVIERASEGICVCRKVAEAPHLQFTVWNERMTEMTGYSIQEINAVGWYQAMYPDPADRARALARAARLFIGDDLVGEERLVVRKDGKPRLLAISTRMLRDQGETPHILALMSDITERKQAEQALRDSEERFRELAENISEVFWISSPDRRRFLYVSPAYERIWGRPAQDLKNRPELWMEAIHPDDRAAVSHPVFDAGFAHTLDHVYRIVRADGGIRWIHDRAFPVRDDTGTVVRIVGVAEDVTSRRDADLERARLATALEQTAEAILITDTHGAIQYVNPAFERITGYGRHEMVGKSPRLLKSGAHDPAFYQQLRSALARGETWKGRFINKRKDGSLFEQEATISPVKDPAGRVVNYFEIGRDITREVQLESQLRHTQKMDAIGQLAGGVAHDFNNLLAVITMHVALVRADDSLPAEVTEALHEIRSAAERAAGLTRQLLLFSRRQVMQARTLDLNEVVDHLTRMLERIIGADVRLEVRPCPEPLFIRADAGMLDQVLMNLVVNARDAMPGGGSLTIDVMLRTDSEPPPDTSPSPGAVPGRHACLRVSDTGCGIAPEVLPRIFEPFFTTKGVGEGTGLGLATVFGIVQQHGGWIRVESTPGKGSRFEVFLPCADVQARDPKSLDPEPASRGAGEGVLVVEDDANVRMATTKVLERHGYLVSTAPDGATALQLWPGIRDRVRLLLTDIVMPGGVSGHHLARQLLAENPGLKVVFTSGYDAQRHGRDFQPIPGERFLQKPASMHDLLEAVRAALDSES